MTDYQTYTLPQNGIRLLYRQIQTTKIAHGGFALDIGSRDETPETCGLAHFWEHMAFKGTQKRKAFHVLNRLEVVGGDLNAFTTKEKIFFHASVLEQYFENALELLTDITFGSVFPEREILKERSVILEEMAMYGDNPAEAIYDAFDALLYGDHPLGWLILGNPDRVKHFRREDFLRFVRQYLNTERVVFAAVGPMPFGKVKRLVERYMGHIPRATATLSRVPPPALPPRASTERKAISQVHCLIGGRAYPLGHPGKVPLAMLINILGGPGMNARLNLTLREKYGLVYAVDANYVTYTDTGNVTIGFATEPRTWERAYALVQKELQRLRDQPLGTRQLHQAKRQLMGQIAMGEESNLGYMLALARSVLDEGYLQPLPELFAQIEAVTAMDILEVMHEVFAPEQLSRLVYLPEETKD